MYIVIELQKTSDTELAHLVTAHADREEAEQKYHQVLSYAAVSTVPSHSALLINEDGNLLKKERYIHNREDAS